MRISSKLPAVIVSVFLIYSCKDKTVAPVLSTKAINNISASSAVSGGEILNDGGSAIITNGVCWNVTGNPTIKDGKRTENTTIKSFTSSITDLSPNTLYFVRAYATNIAGTGYGETVTFTTLGQAPSLETLPAVNIKANSATFSGTINSYNLPTTFIFEYGNANLGYASSSRQSLPAGSSSQSVSVLISGLSSGTTYFFRVIATNEYGTISGKYLPFMTLDYPRINTDYLSDITTNSAICGGTIISDFGSQVLERGICLAKSPNPTILDNKTVSATSSAHFSLNLTNLTPNTTYYLRAYATNGAGTGYGEEQILKTYTGTLSDYDGNSYYTVTIGTQIWMSENLRTKHYCNGDPISNIKDNTQWYNLTNGAYCYYKNDSTNNTIGLLYNWYTTADSRNICPAGWHVSTDDDWSNLVEFLGGAIIAGGKMKIPGTEFWSYPNTGADNSSGFSGIAGGQRGIDGNFFSGGGVFWTSNSENLINARDWYLNWTDATVTRYYDKKVDGFNVRCVKN